MYKYYITRPICMSRFQTCSKMITLLGIRKNVILKVIILQVLIAIPVLYIIKDALLTRVNIDGKDALHVPIVFGTTNITRVTANVTLSSQNGHVAMSQDIYTTAESLNAFIVNNTSGLVLHRDSSGQNENGFINFNYHGSDLMKVPPFKFDSAYKNPCWKEADVLRCLPYFFLAGVKKSGTADLWGHIAELPGVVTTGRKELQWFAKKRFLSGRDHIDNYINMFKGAAKKIAKTISTDTKHMYPLITGEGSPSYLYLNSHWRHLPGNERLDEPKYVILDYIQHILPKAKIMVIFRDPIERLYSDYYHEYGKNLRRKTMEPSPKHFHDIVVTAIQLYEECQQTRTLRSCVYDERIYNAVNNVHMQVGIYHVYWRELLRLFPRDQLLILHNNELQNATSITMKICDFLELRKPTKVVSHHYHQRKEVDAAKGDMLNKTRKLLEDFYRPHNAEMYKLTGDRNFLYKY